jgi:hypothetical protein
LETCAGQIEKIVHRVITHPGLAQGQGHLAMRQGWISERGPTCSFESSGKPIEIK